MIQVYLPAIAGHVPPQMVRALSAFLDFCYLVRRSVIDEAALDAIDDSLARFHRDRVAFRDVRPTGFSLPRQHSIEHYRYLIQLFGAPNGLCSSITESKHIKAVKEPWRRSSHFQALGQMLLTNQRIDKLAACRVNFEARGMLVGSCAAPVVPPQCPPVPLPTHHMDDGDSDPVSGPRVLAQVVLARKKGTNDLFCSFLRPILTALHLASGFPRFLHQIAASINFPELTTLVRHFLFDQLNPLSPLSGSEIALHECPVFRGRASVFKSAIAMFYAPSDQSGVGGMIHQRIRATNKWRQGPARYDCVFIQRDPDLEGMRGMHAVQVVLFFSFIFNHITYPCALVRWFIPVGNEPCRDTGMWIVEPALNADGSRVTSVIHLDCIVRGAHLIGNYGEEFIPRHIHFSDTLSAFQSYYVNKFADHHSYEIAF